VIIPLALAVIPLAALGTLALWRQLA